MLKKSRDLDTIHRLILGRLLKEFDIKGMGIGKKSRSDAGSNRGPIRANDDALQSHIQ